MDIIMGVNLSAGLGLEDIEADPNTLPNGKWTGVVSDSKYVETKKGDLAHVISYRVTEGDHKGAERTEFFVLGNEVQKDNNDNIIGFTPTMTEQQKPWYKKRQMDLGVPEDEINTYDITSLKGRPVTFGTKRNGEYINVNFVELRTEDGDPATTSDEAPSTPDGGMGGLL